MKRLWVMLWAGAWTFTAHAETEVKTVNLTVNGIQVQELHCDLKDANPFALLSVVAALGNEKKDLDACDPGGGAYDVKWTATKGKLQEVKIRKSSKRSAEGCVRKALQKVNSPLDGTCTGILLVGASAQAEKAAAALRPAKTGPAK